MQSEKTLRDITDGLQECVTRAKERVIQEAIAKFESEVRADIGRAAIAVANFYSVEKFAENLIITVRLEKPNAISK